MVRHRQSPRFALHPSSTATIPAASSTTNSALKGAYHSKYDRARAAAQAVAGAVLFKPTVAAAAREFRTSEYLVRLALLRTRIPAPTQMIEAVWGAMSEIDRNAFFDAHQPEVDAWLDEATRPARLRVI